MAFTDDEKMAIRSYLGWSALFFEIDPRLEGQMNRLPTSVPAAVTRVQTILTSLADIDTRLGAALDNLDLTKAEDIIFLGPEQLDALRNQGRMLVNQLSIIFEVSPKRDYFGEGEGGMGGVIPLG